MSRVYNSAIRILYLIISLVIIYSFCRIAFILVNKSQFNLNSPLAILQLIIYGILFDLSAIFLINFILIGLLLLPVPFILNKYYQGILKFLFLTSNSFFILLNLIDIVYFPFIHKRMQFDTFRFLSGTKGTDFYNLLPTFLVQFWYLWFLFIIIIILLFKIYNWSLQIKQVVPKSFSSYLYATSILIISIGLSIIAIRGGFQMKPLHMIHASEMTEVQNIPAVLNSPFTVIKTFNNKSLTDTKYFPDEIINSCYNGVHLCQTINNFNRQNIVIIIVESLSKNYLSFFNGPAKTPFLDSLFSQGLVFTNGFANAKESIQGIPAILSSIPSWQEEPFIFSLYATNRVTSIATLLKNKGYQTSFFHGANNGSMGFDVYSKLVGFDKYYGRNEYNNDLDFDGDWGIWDEPFLQFMAERLSQTTQPFVSTVFTINTHHPFQIPTKYENTFKQNGHPMLACLQYTDYALSRFFETAKNTKWFDNTLFVITADHTGPKLTDEKIAALDDYRIPIVFYKPDGSLKGISETLANQIDIFPSIMHLLNFSDPYFSMGRNLFDNQCEHFSINYNTGIYQYIDSSYCYQFNGQNGIGYYNWQTDPLFNKNLYTNNISEKIRNCDTSLKMMIQSFNDAMLNDKMHLTPISK